MKYYQGLSNLRGQACLCVFLSHLTYSFSDIFYLGTLGHIGVMIFFVMSGFLAYSNHKNISCFGDGLKYVSKKWKHIFPLYFICMIAIAVPVTLLKKSTVKNIIISLLIHIPFLQSWIPIESELQFNDVDWYLSVMMFCWLLEPFVFKVISIAKGNYRKIWGGIVVLYGVRIILYYITSIYIDSIAISEWLMYVFPVTRLFDFLIGAYVAMYMELKPELSIPRIIKIGAVLCLALAYYLVPLKCSEALFLLPLACVLVAYCASQKYRGSFMNQILNTVSKHSEAVFLIHFVMVWYVIRAQKNMGISVIISVGLIIALTVVGVIIYSEISKRIKSLVDKRSTS